MMRTPDGHGKLELTKYHAPAAARGGPQNPPPSTLGLHRVMFAVDDIHDTVARLRAHGAELLARWHSTRASSCSVTSAAPRASSSPWPNRSADASLLRDSGRTLIGARGRSPYCCSRCVIGRRPYRRAFPPLSGVQIWASSL